MNALVLMAETSGGQVEQIARTFGVDWPHLIAQIISFSIVCLLLYRFAYKRVLQALEERRRIIAQGQANSEKIKVELEQIEARRQEVLAQASAQANRFIEEAHAAAARLKEQETRKAIAAAQARPLAPQPPLTSSQPRPPVTTKKPMIPLTPAQICSFSERSPAPNRY